VNTQVTINRILAIVALILAILSLFVDGPPLLVVAVIVLALAVLL